MAYSRWGESTWYTFWTYNSSPKEFSLPKESIKMNQTFEICDIPIYHITYGEIKSKGINKIISEIKEFYSKTHILKKPIINIQTDVNEYEDIEVKAKNPSDEELIELTSYINQFVKDVDDHFKLKSYFEYEWFYPAKRRFTNIKKKILKALNIFY